MEPTWSERTIPRPISAMLLRGVAATRLVERLLTLEKYPWTGVAGRGWVALMGPELPWSPEALWLGPDPDAPSLLLPTLYQPDLHPMLLERAVTARFHRPCGPYAVVPAICGGPLLLALGAARPLAVAPLRHWLGQ